MSKNLVIVESPAKAKTIEGYLGADYTVKSSYGHVRDLVKSGMGINIKNNFEPVYEISPEKADVIKELQKLAKKAEMVWLATDEDREGEAISWHLFEALELKADKTKRIVFHEITKKAITEAIQNPRSIDKHLVDAQQARRVLDRLVGFELSPVLWKKVRPSLSAGRVQSVTVRLVVEREREIDSFKITSSFKVVAIFDANGKTFKAELPKKFKTKEEAEDFLKTCIGSQFKVKNLEVKPGKKSPSAPFTTSTLQQEASRKLGFSVSQTMVIAQKLYESGKISYMRTDSVTLSQDALDMAKKVILSNYGEKYLELHQYKTKQATAQEAHEAIRPTDMAVESVDADARDQRLYDLIRKRTLASQMADAVLEKTVVTISSKKSNEELVATGEVIKFDGFLKIYMESSDEEEEENPEGIIPAMNIGDDLMLMEAAATERFTHPPARYTEASLVKKLEELGIGRPSTYAPTISTVQKRGYVVKEERTGTERSYHVMELKGSKISHLTKTENTGAEKNKLFPTDIGVVVTDFLVLNFKDILDYNFTAYVEKEFDDIANGDMKWQKMIKEFYDPFHKNVEVTTETSERASGEKILGKDPASGLTLLVRVGRFGPMAQIGTTEEIEAGKAEKARYAKLRPNQRIETITFEEAVDLFKLPRTLGEFEEKTITIAIGRFGPYAKHNDVFVSLKKEDDPYTITHVRAIELIEEKRRVQAERIIKVFDEDKEIQVLNGRWGPYIAAKDKNVKIPKDKDPHSLTLEEIYELVANAPEPKKWGKKKFGNKNEGSFGNKNTGFKKAAGAGLKKPASTEAKDPVKKAASAKPAAKKAPAKKASSKKK